MAEYIEREEVHELVQSLTKYAWASPDNTGHRVTVDADDVNFGVDKIPAADVVPVQHGRWVSWVNKVGYLVWCSECNKHNNTDKTHYCPNCGAKMDGVEDE